MIRWLKRRFGSTRVRYHEWVQFADRHGSGYCEPEAFILLKEFVFLVECKLTGKPEGKLQLEWLYAPVLSSIFARPVRSLLICKCITEKTPGPFVKSVEEFLLSDMTFATLHWLPEP